MRKIYFLFILLIISLVTFADEGDTIVVQTIDFETPVNPGWNAPREGKYLFPSEDISFSKILMSYTLKCDPGQSPACGEWDYTTHTKIWESTGEYDSTMYTHPRFKVNNSAPDTFYVMNSPSFYYVPWLEYSNQTSAISEVTVGSYNSNLNLPFDNSTDGKAQFIYDTDELSLAGLSAGDITGMVLSISGNIDFKHFSIKIKSIENDTLPIDSLINFGFTQVFEKNISLEEGNNQINFSFPFYWDGSANMLIEISYAESLGSGQLSAMSTNPNQTSVSAKSDSFLHFSGWDLIKIPIEVFETIDTAITISFWQYGDPLKQPMNNSIFHGNDSEGNRVLNSHLPWSNGQIYWDAGQDEGYDRINRSAPHTSDYEGRWNHWAFSKNADNGSMRMYLNGNLFFIGSAKYRTMAGITEFYIGGAHTTNFYEGFIDDFSIWDAEFDFFTVPEWMNREIDETHPYYENLRAYYKFDEGSGTLISDSSPNGFDATGFFGQAQWKNYEGKNRHKYASRLNAKPFIKLQTGDYNTSLLDSIVMVDTVEHAANSIVFYEAENSAFAVDTILKWPTYYDNYIYNSGGQAIDSSFVAPDSTLFNDTLIYYGLPFEVQNPWEIGRFITPYGNNLSLGNGFTWVYDVTDYAPLLRDSVRITAGNFQELLDLEFHMIEGTPCRDVIEIDKVYSGYWYLNVFEEQVPPISIDLNPAATQWKIKTRTTGHLFDNATNCAEFCPNIHTFLVDNELVSTWQIIQECAENPLYPQGGTWIYDRAGWCPGMDVTEQDIEITDYVSGDAVILDYNSQYDQYGTYSMETHLFSYGDYNFSTDAAIVEIIAPNNLKRYGRFNPTATNPIIVIKNQGSDNLTSLQINYGPENINPKSFMWTGNLAPMEVEEVALDAFLWEEWQLGNGNFEVNLINPNGTSDENPINNTYFSNYSEVDIYPRTIVIRFLTNKAAYQNYYEIYSSSGVKVFEKTG